MNNKHSQKPTIGEIKKELDKLEIPTEYYEESISIIYNRLEAKKDTNLHEALYFIKYWIGIQ